MSLFDAIIASTASGPLPPADDDGPILPRRCSARSPELLRLRGLLVAATDPAAAARAYQEAAELARAFGLASLELRAATALAAVSDGALARLADVVARFGDAEQTPDLADARAVLARLRPGPPTAR